MTRRLALISRDPGATNQMVGVWWLLQHLGEDEACEEAEHILFADQRDAVEVVAMSHSYGLEVWRQSGHGAVDLTGLDSQAENLLSEHKISVLVTGLDDVDASLSRRFWRFARALNIPVIALTDNTENLALRCHDDLGARFWPDVLLLSHGGADELIAAGCPPQALHEIPDLHRVRLRHETASRGVLREGWQVQAGEHVVLFASESTREMAPLRAMDYDEITVLETLIEALDRGRLPDGTPIGKPRLVIRPHPRDSHGKYDAYCTHTNFPILVSNAGTPIEAIMSADLIVGMASAFLDEARLLGQPVVSLLEGIA